MSIKLPFLNSSNDYFHDEVKVQANRELVRTYLTVFRKYTPAQTAIYLTAYDYFRDNPLHYDGATMTEDLPDIDDLELASMLHDYLYLEHNAAGSLKYCMLADKLFRNEMSKMKKSTWNRGVRFVLLFLKTLLGYTFYCYVFKNRRMSDADKINVDGIITTLSHRCPRKWYEEFLPEITWFVIIMLSLIFMIY